jgi:hypothetical protein
VVLAALAWAAGADAASIVSLVFNVRTAQSVNTFLVDGAVAGTWRCEDGRVRLEPFGRIDRASRRELDEEAERLASLHA